MKQYVTILVMMLYGKFNLVDGGGVRSNCHGIDHCISCHRGDTYIFWVCDQCDQGYGVNTKYDSSDTCIYCDSVIANCLECSNPEDAWSCGKCAEGYELVVVPFKDDRCIKRSLNKNLSFLNGDNINN
jgi:hypothetical protein